MEDHFIESLVEAISYGYEDEKNEVAKKYGIEYKKSNLNIAKIKRSDNLKKLLDNQDPDRFIHIDKRSFLFLDKDESKLYAFMTEAYKNQVIRDFKKNGKLNYITAMILLKNPSIDEIDDNIEPLFDTTPYFVDPYEDDTYEEASEKAKNIFETYNQFIEKICIITRENTNGDSPRIMVHHFSKNFDLLLSEDWTKYLPNAYNNNFENDKKEKPKKEIKKKRKTKHTKLKKNDEKIE